MEEKMVQVKQGEGYDIIWHFYLSACPSICLWICIFVFLSVCVSVYQSVCMSVNLYACLCVHQSVYLSVYHLLVSTYSIHALLVYLLLLYRRWRVGKCFYKKCPGRFLLSVMPIPWDSPLFFIILHTLSPLSVSLSVSLSPSLFLLLSISLFPSSFGIVPFILLLSFSLDPPIFSFSPYSSCTLLHLSFILLLSISPSLFFSVSPLFFFSFISPSFFYSYSSLSVEAWVVFSINSWDHTYYLREET